MTPSSIPQAPLLSEWHLAQSGEASASIFRTSREFLCADPEGWGPVSEIRWDLTPCFLDVWLLFVSAWGLLAGAGAIYYLFKTRTPQEVKKNWHYYAKL